MLDDTAAAEAEAAVIPNGVAGKTPGQIRAAIGRAVVKADPDAARRRRAEAEKDPRVELWREDAGTAAICGYGLPPDAALAADQAITTAALELKAAGLAGTMDQLRARAYLDALLGQDSRPTAPQPASPARPGQPAGPDRQPGRQYRARQRGGCRCGRAEAEPRAEPGRLRRGARAARPDGETPRGARGGRNGAAAGPRRAGGATARPAPAGPPPAVPGPGRRRPRRST